MDHRATFSWWLGFLLSYPAYELASELSENDLEEKLNITEEIKEMQDSIVHLKNSQEKNDYLLSTSLMLYHYFDENSTYVESHAKKSKSNNDN